MLPEFKQKEKVEINESEGAALVPWCTTGMGRVPQEMRGGTICGVMCSCCYGPYKLIFSTNTKSKLW